MKRLLSIALFVLIMFSFQITHAETKPLNFAWEQPIAYVGQVVGWTLYYSETSGEGYTKLTDIDFVDEQTEYNQAIPWGSLPRKVVYFVMTARSNLGEESEYSEECEVDLSILPIPINFRLVIGE